MIIFNITSAEIKTKSADLLLKMIMILKELRIAQQCSQIELTLVASLLRQFTQKGSLR
jgi:hypothetical protein